MIKNDEIIEQIVKDKNYKIYRTGLIKTLVTKNGRPGVKWRTIGNRKSDGYIRIRYRNSFLLVHRIIARKYLGELNDFFINHKDGNKSNNDIENIELVTFSENIKHSHRVLKQGKTRLFGKSNPRFLKMLKDIESRKDDLIWAKNSSLPITQKAKALNLNRKTLSKWLRYVG